MRNLVRGWEYNKPDYLCFTANMAGSTVQLRKVWNPTEVSLEISTNWISWTNYTIWDVITLSNIWDKVYWRNKSESDTGFNWHLDKYRFVMTWSIAWSWDINYLLNKNSTDTVSWFCYYYLFENCISLTTTPSLPATNVSDYCYAGMFKWCTNLTAVPELPATSLFFLSYSSMFKNCSNIKISETQDSDYTQEYRIPTTWIGTVQDYSLNDMFGWTWWTFAWTPNINTTYYLHKDNTIV